MSLFSLVSVLAEERLDVLERGRFERLEPVPLVYTRDDANHMLPAPHVFRQEVARAARRRSACRHQAVVGVDSVRKSRR